MRLLVIEDEPTLQSQLLQTLRGYGYAVDASSEGEEAHFLGESTPFDAIILDLGLPGRDGLSILKQWRTSGVRTPVLVLTARSSWQEKVDGIDAGADDYLAKPFRMEELMARIRALIRRASGHSSNELICGPVHLNTRTSRVLVHNAPILLTSHEYRVLSYLMHHQGKIISRSELTEHLYAQDFDRDSNTIEVFIGRLRRKLNSNIIRTVRGLGYQVVSDSTARRTGS